MQVYKKETVIIADMNWEKEVGQVTVKYWKEYVLHKENGEKYVYEKVL